jgi:hypothetical protein
MGIRRTRRISLKEFLLVERPELECWNWEGYISPSGYGYTTVVGQKERRVHRLMWALKFGPVPEGKEVCHKCDNRGCINPSHLFLGTHQDNMHDSSVKGRMVNNWKHNAEYKPKRPWYEATVVKGHKVVWETKDATYY